MSGFLSDIAAWVLVLIGAEWIFFCGIQTGVRDEKPWHIFAVLGLLLIGLAVALFIAGS